MIGDDMAGMTVELCVSRSVRDTARLLEAVDGAAPGDPYVAPAPLRPYTEELTTRAADCASGSCASSLIDARGRGTLRRGRRDGGEADRVARPRRRGGVVPRPDADGEEDPTSRRAS